MLSAVRYMEERIMDDAIIKGIDRKLERVNKKLADIAPKVSELERERNRLVQAKKALVGTLMPPSTFKAGESRYYGGRPTHKVQIVSYLEDHTMRTPTEISRETGI